VETVILMLFCLLPQQQQRHLELIG